MAPGGLGTADGANDIAYNHAVCPHGFAFTLRGFGVQTGANGNTRANQEYAAVVYMGGEKDGRPVTEEALPVIAEVIRMWQAAGCRAARQATRLLHRVDLPGPRSADVARLDAEAVAGRQGVTVPRGGREGRDAGLADGLHPLAPGRRTETRSCGRSSSRNGFPEPAWEAAAQVDRIANMMGPQQPFLDWAEWRRQGAKKEERPRSAAGADPEVSGGRLSRGWRGSSRA